MIRVCKDGRIDVTMTEIGLLLLPVFELIESLNLIVKQNCRSEVISV